MYTVCVQGHYDAAHFLRNYQGQCEKLHGHRWIVEVFLRASDLDDSGIAFDFVEVKRHLTDLTDRLDHENLNDLPPFDSIEPSAENQARYLFDELSSRLPAAYAAGLASVRVWETPIQWAEYTPDPGRD